MNQRIEPTQIQVSLGVMFQTVNCYLIPGEQLTLIDCGLFSEKNWEDFQKKIKAHGYQVSDIEQVIITHEHSDHIGLLPEIMAHSEAIVRVPKMIESWFTHPKEMAEKESLFLQKIFGTLGFSVDQLNEVIQHFKQVINPREIENPTRIHTFEEGDFLKMGNTTWEALNTPGHCPTQFVFLQKEQKRIFGSDMLLPITPMPIIAENPDGSGQLIKPLNQLLNSFERLRAFDIQTVYPGHGPVFSNANAMIDKQLARIEMRKEECFEAIKSGLTTPYQINRKMYPYQQMPPDFSGMYMVLGYMDLLRVEGRI